MTGADIKRIRDKLNLTQLQLGRLLKLRGDHPDRVVRKWEAGANIPGPITVALSYIENDKKLQLKS